jgi:hypothetical protein
MITLGVSVSPDRKIIISATSSSGQ